MCVADIVDYTVRLFHTLIGVVWRAQQFDEEEFSS